MIKHIVSAALAIAAQGLASQTLAQPAPGSATAAPLVIRFAGEVGAKPFKCGATYDGIGTPASSIAPTDFRLYVTGVELIDRSGKATPVVMDEDLLWQRDGIALIDFEDGSGPCRGGNPGLNTEVKGRAPKGDYVGLRFTMGMPFEAAHGDMTTAAAPLDISAMFWGWRAGYRYLKIDMTGQGGDAANRSAGFSVHLGDAGCLGPRMSSRPTNCAQINVVPVSFDVFDAKTDVVVADVARLLATTNVTINAPGTQPGCMSDAIDTDCPSIFANLGLPFSGAPAGKQVFFQRRGK